MLEYIYIFAWVICIDSQVLFDLSSSKREKGLWTRVGLNSPPVSTKGHTRVGFCGGMLLNMGVHLDARKEHEATRELRQVRLHGVFLLLVACAEHHLPSRLTFRAYNNPILKTEFPHNF